MNTVIKIKTLSLSLALCLGAFVTAHAQQAPEAPEAPAAGTPLPIAGLVNANTNGVKGILKSHGVDASDPASVEAFLTTVLAELSAADKAAVLEKIAEVLTAELLEGGSASGSEVTAAVKAVAKSIVKVVAASGGSAEELEAAAASVKSGAGKAVTAAGGSIDACNAAVIAGGNEALDEAGSDVELSEIEVEDEDEDPEDITEYDNASDEQ